MVPLLFIVIVVRGFLRLILSLFFSLSLSCFEFRDFFGGSSAFSPDGHYWSFPSSLPYLCFPLPVSRFEYGDFFNSPLEIASDDCRWWLLLSSLFSLVLPFCFASPPRADPCDRCRIGAFSPPLCGCCCHKSDACRGSLPGCLLGK